jgi:hypothetical protein
LKKNSLVFLRQSTGDLIAVNGEIRDAPYLNVHGESEKDLRYGIAKQVDFRIGQPQFLSQERYDKVRAMLLKHEIETGIARKIESSYDAGVRIFKHV